MADHVEEPLLAHDSASTPNYSTIARDAVAEDLGPDIKQSRSVENDVLPETSVIGRNLGWGGAFILIISRVIGSGIFATPGAVVKGTGSIGLALCLWIVGALVSWAILAMSLEYGCMLPRSGGIKVYLEFTYRKPRFLASTVVAILLVLLGFTASNCIVFGEYVLFALRIEPTPVLQKALAVGLLLSVTIIHGCFLRTGIFIQTVLGWFKVVLVVFMVGTGLVVVLLRPDTNAKSMPIKTWDTLWDGTNWSWGLMSKALFQVLYSYAGLDNVNNVMNEVKNPVKTLKSVAPTALLTACVLYLLVNAAYFMVVPLEEIKHSGEMVAALFFERVFGQSVGRTILPIAVALSAVGNVMVVTFSLARLNQEIARQGFIPFSKLLSSSKPFGAPLGGLIVQLIPSLLVILIPPSGNVYSFILEVEGYPGSALALAMAIGLIWLRFRRPDLERPYKAWIPAVVLAIGFFVAMLVAPFFPPPKNQRQDIFYAAYALVGISIILFAVVFWFVWTRLLPRWKGYRLEEQVRVLDDGTTITKLIKIPKGTENEQREVLIGVQIEPTSPN